MQPTVRSLLVRVLGSDRTTTYDHVEAVTRLRSEGLIVGGRGGVEVLDRLCEPEAQDHERRKACDKSSD
jgi:hypothetical protein